MTQHIHNAPVLSPWYRSPRGWRWGLVIVYAGSIFWLSSLPGESIPSVSTSDKILHAIEFGGLTFLLCRAMRAQIATYSYGTIACLSVLMTMAYGWTDEMHQLFVPGRMTDLSDFLADSLGALFAAWGWSLGGRYWPWLR